MDNLNNLYVPVKERIFALLKSKSIQQKDFAKAIGVNAVTITDWKNEKSASFMKKLTPIAEALGTSEVWLLTGEGELLDDDTIQKLKDIADSLGVHPFDLLGFGSKLDLYRISVDDLRRKDGGEVSAEDKRLLNEMMAMGPRQIYDKLGPEDKREFWSLFQDYFQARTTSGSKEKPTPVSGDGPNGAQQQVYKRLEKLTPENLKKAEEYLDLLLMSQDNQDNG